MPVAASTNEQLKGRAVFDGSSRMRHVGNISPDFLRFLFFLYDDTEQQLLGLFFIDRVFLHENIDRIPNSIRGLVLLNIPTEIIVGESGNMSHDVFVLLKGWTITSSRADAHPPAQEEGR